MITTLYFFSIITLLTSILSLSDRVYWYIRAWDAMRVQLTFLCMVLGSISLLTSSNNPLLHYSMSAAFLLFFCYHFSIIYKYTPLHSVELAAAENPQNIITFYSANVRQKNKNYDSLLDSVRTKNPNVILLTETDSEWVKNVDVLRETHPYALTEPLENTLGMALYSKFPFEKSMIRYLVEDDVPSIHVVLKVGVRPIQFIGLHPRPPAPQTEDDRNKNREMIAAASMTNWNEYPTIVTGDLNDVAWSKITSDFKKISGLLDPRVGRGFFNTYNVFIPFFRMPIDHFFVSSDFKLVEIKRLKRIGSDHFPVMIKLDLT